MVKLFNRVYSHYLEWEETHAGLWRRPCGMERDEHVQRCSAFMSDTAAFRAAMFKAIELWPKSCEVNFTASGSNHVAWLGWAACCIAIGCPEEPTRSAWWTLTQEQRDDADAAALEAIEEWAKRYEEVLICRSGQLALMF